RARRGHRYLRIMRWLVHSEKTLYADEWIDVRAAHVEQPGGRRLEHRVVRTPADAGAVVTDARDRVLLVRRHRFITDTWAWEIPLGVVGDGEAPQAAAARAVEQETGWRPGPLRPLLAVQPSNSLMDTLRYVYRAESAAYAGPPGSPAHAGPPGSPACAGPGAPGGQVGWLPVTRIRRLVADGEIVCGTSLSALLYVLLDRHPTVDPPFDPAGPVLLRDLPGLEP
ncbi:MAG TPA: NUDIX domain-containing protein, partial [Nonomuraea sp.]|nr:NUDIX domain-containing protein [Nonomuraea sp.]